MPLAMRRLYVKVDGRWRTVGWICPNCGEVRIDAEFPLKEYKTVDMS